ncbi:MAG: BlaI/MecI/CopY family transcriptional regulator [Candidatus Sumerlaeota bacterium]|nr:BlaI/MecI/CopY family transcriptional regulator [Candidatus Sumerlaeota bacterium]
MPTDTHQLTRRERQIMDIIYASSEATATDVLNAMSDAPTRTAVRALIRILEEKGHLKHAQRGREFVYQPIAPRQRAGLSAMRRLLSTFFEGSLEKAVASHLSDPASECSEEELDRLAGLIRKARKERR